MPRMAPWMLLPFSWILRRSRAVFAAGPEETTVTDVMTRWGVWEFGRFAGIYRGHFGELPSETLRRRRLVISSISAT